MSNLTSTPADAWGNYILPGEKGTEGFKNRQRGTASIFHFLMALVRPCLTEKVMDFSNYTCGMRLLAPVVLVVLFTSSCVQHIASDRIAVVFGNPITYGAVETDLMTVTRVRSWPGIPTGGETISDRAKRCGWSEDDLELRRFRHLFLLYFKQGYSSRIRAKNARPVPPIERSRMPSAGSGYSVRSFILVERPDDPQAVSIVPRPDYAAKKPGQIYFSVYHRLRLMEKYCASR